MALGGRPHDREAEARAGAVVTAAPEALEDPFGFLAGHPRSFVGDGEPCDRTGPAGLDHDPARTVAVGVLDEVRECPLQGRPVAAHRHRFRCHDVHPLRLAGDLVQPDRLVGRRGRFLAREREQIVGEPCEPAAVVLELRTSSSFAPCRARYEMLPTSAVSGVRSSCDASARNRRSASRARSSAASISLSVRASRPTSSSASGCGSRLRGSPVRSISAAAPARRPSGLSAGRINSASAAAPAAAATSAASSTTRWTSWSVAFEVAGRRGDRNGAAGRRAAGIRERGDVDTKVVAAELGAGVPAGAARDHAAPERLHGEHTPAERQRSRDDAAAVVDHLDIDLLRADRRVEGAGRRQEGRSGRAQLRDVDRPLAQRPVERAVEVPCDQQVDAGADDHEREQDGEKRGENRPSSERARNHRSSMKPTPRTVAINGGAPSDRRRYET